MFRFPGLVAAASLSTCILAGSAGATTITAGSTTALSPGLYTASVTTNAGGAFTDQYTFTTSGSLGTSTQLTVDFAPPKGGFGIKNAELAWFEISPFAATGPSLVYTDATGTPISNGVLDVVLPYAGTFVLDVMGTYLPSGGEYQIAMDVSKGDGGREGFAPLPAGIILFASGLSGLGIMGRRRRKKLA